MIKNVPGGVSQESTYRTSDLIDIKYIKNDHWAVSGIWLKLDITISKIDSITICHIYPLEVPNQHFNPYPKNFRIQIFRKSASHHICCGSSRSIGISVTFTVAE